MLQPVGECFCGLDRGARFLENGIKSFWGIELGKKGGETSFFVPFSNLRITKTNYKIRKLQTSQKLIPSNSVSFISQLTCPQGLSKFSPFM